MLLLLLLLLLLQRPMCDEVHLAAPQLLEAPAVAGCMLTYLAAHQHLVEPLLDLFDIFGVRVGRRFE